MMEDVLPREKVIIDPRPAKTIFEAERATRRAILTVRPDLFHKPVGQLPLVTGLVPMVFGIADFAYRNVPMTLMKRVYKSITYRLSARKAAAIVCVSEATRKQAIEILRVDPGKVFVVHHGATSFSDVVEDSQNNFCDYFLTFGHHRHKNVEAAILALASMPSPFHGYKLVVVGRCPNQSELEELARKHEVEQRVIFAGGISDSQLRALYRDAAALVFLSRHEGFGLPVLEAMALQCPVVASDAYSLPEVVGNAARVFDCDDYQSIGQEMQKLIENEPYRQERIHAGVARVKVFSWERAAQETEVVYRYVLGNRTARAEAQS